MVRLFCLVASMERRPDFRSPSTHACRDRHRDCGVANMETLKRRKRGIVRQVPLPQYVLSDLDRDFGLRLPAMRREPGGETHLALESYDGLAARKRSHCGSWYLRHTRHAEGIAHGFGVNAFETSVPPHLVQRWLGPASLRRPRSPVGEALKPQRSLPDGTFKIVATGEKEDQAA